MYHRPRSEYNLILTFKQIVEGNLDPDDYQTSPRSQRTGKESSSPLSNQPSSSPHADLYSSITSHFQSYIAL